MVAPVHGLEGVRGAIAVSGLDGPVDPALVAELGARLGAALAGIEAGRRHTGRIAALHTLSAALAGAVTPTEVRRVVAEHGRAMIGAQRSVFVVPAERPGHLALVDSGTLADAVRRDWATFPVDSDLPLARAFHEGRTFVHESPEALIADAPSMARIVGVQGTRASVATPLRSGDRVVGAVAFGFDAPRTFDADDLAMIHTLASQCAVVLERAALYEQTRDDAERQRFLADASEQLAASLDAGTTLRKVVELAVPAFSTWAVVDLFEPDDTVRRAAFHHADPAVRAFAEGAFTKWGPRPDEVRAFRSSGPVLVAEVTDAMLVAGAHGVPWVWAEHLAASRALGLRSLILAPIRVHGAVEGLISFARDRAHRPFDEADLELAVDLAHRVGGAVQNARLYADVRDAEARVVRAQRRFERMADATPDILFVIEVPAGRSLYTSGEVGRILGWSPSELAGFGPGLLDALVHPDDLGPLRIELVAVARLADGARLEQRFRMRHATGDWRWFDVRSVVFTRDADGRPSELLGVARDVTEDRDREVALRDSEERYRLATEAVRGVVYEWDVGSDRVRQTGGLVDVTGYQPDDRTADRGWWRSLVHPDDLRTVDAAFGAALAAGLDRLECAYRIRHRDGSWRHVVDSARLVRDPATGGVVRMVGCTLDVTARVSAQQELEEADRRKDQFLALLAHELRNPLAAVRSAADVLALDRSSGGPIAARDAIVRQVGHMARMLEDLFDISRMSTGKLLIRAEPIELGALVAEVVDDHRGDLERDGIAVEVSLADEPLYVRGDPTRIAQIVSNLLHNAGKYTARGGAIAVAIDGSAFDARISVADTGTGIDPALLPRLFEPFVQGERVLDQSRGGLGLGLALVRGLVEVHRGRVDAHSDGIGHGSRFTVTLPLGEPPTHADPEPLPSGAARRILIVEDNDDAAEMLRLLLEYDGHVVEVASDGAQAIDRARAFVPEVVLCDIGLPGDLDGYDVARAIRAMPDGGGGVLVALTGYGQADDLDRARAAGFDRHVTKPVDPDELQRIIVTPRRP
ncbi:MAG: PAS domain-containing protein [Myxococcota bacterium]